MEKIDLKSEENLNESEIEEILSSCKNEETSAAVNGIATETQENHSNQNVKQKSEQNCLTYQYQGTLIKTDYSKNSMGYMKYYTEYQRNYSKQHNVENIIPSLHDNINKLFNDFQDLAHLPKPQLVKPPYSSISIDAMTLDAKKKLLEKYYKSVKTYYMDDMASFDFAKSRRQQSVKTLEDMKFEKQRLLLNSTTNDIQTSDEIEAIAQIFYKYNSDIKQISGLQAEIVKKSNLLKQKAFKEKIKKSEEDIDEKILRNEELMKQCNLRFPFKRDHGFSGYIPNIATYDEAVISKGYSTFCTMNNMLEQQHQRRIQLEKFDRNDLKFYKEYSNPEKVPDCFEFHKLSL